MCKQARMNNLMKSGTTLINGCYYPARCSGISKGSFLSCLLKVLAKLGEEEVGGRFLC